MYLKSLQCPEEDDKKTMWPDGEVKPSTEERKAPGRVKGSTQHRKWTHCVVVCERQVVARVYIRLEYTRNLLNLRANSAHVQNLPSLEQYLEQNETSINPR